MAGILLLRGIRRRALVALGTRADLVPDAARADRAGFRAGATAAHAAPARTLPAPRLRPAGYAGALRRVRKRQRRGVNCGSNAGTRNAPRANRRWQSAAGRRWCAKETPPAATAGGGGFSMVRSD